MRSSDSFGKMISHRHAAVSEHTTRRSSALLSLPLRHPPPPPPPRHLVALLVEVCGRVRGGPGRFWTVFHMLCTRPPRPGREGLVDSVGTGRDAVTPMIDHLGGSCKPLTTGPYLHRGHDRPSRPSRPGLPDPRGRHARHARRDRHDRRGHSHRYRHQRRRQHPSGPSY